ncbi:MAG: hypothetical protein IH621_03080 [Krumholzibacteria bacterium]|nr:hypothetical protein [Candidatus Krumholzibacteria bacterium]
MRRVAELGDLAKTVARRSCNLREHVRGLALPIGAPEDRIIAYTAIEALNLWSEFVRSYYLSCCLGCRCRSGTPVTVGHGFTTIEAAIGFAVTTIKSSRKSSGPWTRRDEPDWKVPHTLLKMLEEIDASNLDMARTALSYQTRVFKDLPTVRNFFAHRQEDTAKKVVAVAHSNGMSSRRRPAELMCTRLPNHPQNLLAGWLDDIRIVAIELCG